MSASSGRREEFQLSHCIEQREKGSVFVKYAVAQAGQPFLDTVAEREMVAEIKFRGRATVVKGSRDGDKLIYPLLQGPTLEAEIGRSIAENGKDFGLDALLLYRDFLFGLPQTQCVPKDFYDYIGIGRAACELPLTCLGFGPYDCIPRNLIRDAEGWNVLDSEWTFAFPIPRSFLLWRGIHSLIYGLQQAIQSAVSSARPVVLYQGYGRARYYVPLAWLREFNFSIVDLARFTDFETRFQAWVLKPEAVRKGRIRLTKRYVVYRTLPSAHSLLIRYEESVKRAAQLVQSQLIKK